MPFGRLGGREGRRVLGERFVQPQVVPPLHGDEVAEPHVGELVEDRDDAAFLDRVGDLRAEHVGLGEGHSAGVLHGACVELGHEQLVVLLERVGVVELLFVEREAFPRLLEDVVGVEVLGEALAGEDAERNRAAVAAGQLTVHGVVRSRDQRSDVRGDDGGRGEGPGLRAFVGGDRFRSGRIADDLPVVRCGHCELERGLQVGLLEYGEHAA